MTAVASARAAAPITHKQVLVVFSGLVLVMLLAALDSTIVSTALPTIVGELGGLEHLAWVVTAYLLAQTVVTPLYGKLGDLYGRKGVLQSAIVLFLVGSALCGMSQSMTQLIVFRAIQGLGGGGLDGRPRRRSSATSSRRASADDTRASSARCSASRASPVRCSADTSRRTCRGAGSSTSTCRSASLALVVLAATLPAQRASASRHAIDYAGAALLAVALSAIILVADLGGTAYPWSSPLMLALIACGGRRARRCFLLVERRAARAGAAAAPVRATARSR